MLFFSCLDKGTRILRIHQSTPNEESSVHHLVNLKLLIKYIHFYPIFIILDVN